MINIIREDLRINPDLSKFPTANANIAIFGTQSSGKSTLLNHVFGTKFPVLDTSITRERCTKGVWLHSISNFNVIDTEGFDSADREPHQKMFQKQVALFCLALSDVLLINLWMNEIGRYEASHSHILKAVIHASQRLIAKQNRKIIFVVRDCTDDADRSILREELSSQMQSIIKAQNKKSNIKFNLQYFMMSHLFEDEKEFKKEAKELQKIINLTKKSNLSNYTEEDRMVYVKGLWEQVTTDSHIDLRTAEDAIRNYALERVKRETIDFMENWLECIVNLQKYKTYSRFKEAAAREARVYFMDLKPKHLRESEVEPYLEVILQTLDSRQNKYFMTVLLPNEEDRLIEEEYRKKINVMMGENVVYFKRNMQRRREQIEEDYKIVVRGLREHAKMTRRFVQKIEAANSQYDQYLQHLQNVFKIELETALNQEVDKQTKDLSFDGTRIKKVIFLIEEKHKAEAKTELHQIWDRIVVRTSNSTLVERLKSEGQNFSTEAVGAFMGNQKDTILRYYQRLQDKAQKYLQNLLNFLSEQEETNATLQRVQSIRRLISQLIDSKMREEDRRFKITLVFVVLMMFFFFSEFKFFLRMFGMGKKRLRNWMWLYTLTMISFIGVILYRKRDYLKKFIEPLEE